MSEAEDILKRARERARSRERAGWETPTDYAELNKMVKRQRAALTRAINSGDRDKVVMACANAVREWNQPGLMWPDDWTRWQCALDDALPWNQQVDLADLV